MPTKSNQITGSLGAAAVAAELYPASGLPLNVGGVSLEILETAKWKLVALVAERGLSLSGVGFDRSIGAVQRCCDDLIVGEGGAHSGLRPRGLRDFSGSSMRGPRLLSFAASSSFLRRISAKVELAHLMVILVEEVDTARPLWIALALIPAIGNLAAAR